MTEKKTSGSTDLGQAEVKESFAEAQKVGFFGNKVDPLPNSAHSLESGPDAPPLSDQVKESA